MASPTAVSIVPKFQSQERSVVDVQQRYIVVLIRDTPFASLFPFSAPNFKLWSVLSSVLRETTMIISLDGSTRAYHAQHVCHVNFQSSQTTGGVAGK